MRKGYGNTIRPGLPLPSDYEDAAACCEPMMSSILWSRVEKLDNLLREVPSFAVRFSNLALSQHITVVSRPKEPSDSTECRKADLLFWCSTVLIMNFGRKKQMDPAYLFAYLDDLLTADRSAAAGLDYRLMDQLSNVAALRELRKAIRLQRPPTRVLTVDEASKLRSGGGWERWRAAAN